MLSKLVFFCLFLCSQIQSQNVSFYPSDINLRPFVQTLKSVADQLEEVKRDGMKRLELVTEFLDHYTYEHMRLLREGLSYLGKPIRRFKSIYGLTKGLNLVREVIKERRVFMKDTALQYPTLEDMELNVLIFSRLQRCYLLNVTQLAAGILNTSYSESGQVYVEHFSKMTSSDCYMIGKILCKYQQCTQGVLWLAEALMLYDRDKAISDFDKREIYLSLASACESLNASMNILKLTKELLFTNAEYIDDRRIAQYIIAYQTKLDSEREAQSKRKDIVVLKELRTFSLAESSNFRRHCRGEMRVPPEITKRLKCWYFTGYHPFLRLAPIRTEQLYIKPDIFQYYDVINNREIENITSIEPKLQECLFDKDHKCKNNSVQHCLKKIIVRQCMTKETNSSADTISQKVFDLTGLWSKDQPIYATYYSYGHHFLTHLDSLRDAATAEVTYHLPVVEMDGSMNMSGNPLCWATGIYGSQQNLLQVYTMCLYREQTVLFYLSNVEQGGATVFPLLGVTVFPRKGSALSWTNMYPSRSNDVTYHSACPVLRGSKWVATKWVNYDGNELKRPCVDEFPNRLPSETPPPVSVEKYLSK